MTLNQIYKALNEYYHASLCTKSEFDNKAAEALEALNEYCWRPVDEELPPVDENGTSDLVTVSFANATLYAIGRYWHDEDEDGAFYDGDTEDTFAKIGLIVNAWAKLPETWRKP